MTMLACTPTTTGPSWLWVISVLSLCLGVAALIWQALTWWQDRRPRVLIEQVGDSRTDLARVPVCAPLYTVNVAIINQSPRTPMVIIGMRLDAEWDHGIQLASDPREDPRQEDSPQRDVYTLSGANESLLRCSVINHRLYAEGSLGVGGVIKGTVIGWGQRPIPGKYPHGKEVKIEFSVQDQNKKWHQESVSVWICRPQHGQA